MHVCAYVCMHVHLFVFVFCVFVCLCVCGVCSVWCTTWVGRVAKILPETDLVLLKSERNVCVIFYLKTFITFIFHGVHNTDKYSVGLKSERLS